jgi:predicted ATPase
MMFAYCYRDGQIFFGRKIPDGALEVAQGMGKALRKEMSVAARHGYKEGVLLVPGIPEAPNEKEALEALNKFKTWLNYRKEKK